METPGPLWWWRWCLAVAWAGGSGGHAHSAFTCEPIKVHRCLGMTYNMTFFPNMMEHYDQDIAASKMETSPGRPERGTRKSGRDVVVSRGRRLALHPSVRIIIIIIIIIITTTTTTTTTRIQIKINTMETPGPLWWWWRWCLAVAWAGGSGGHAHSAFTCEPIKVHRCLGMTYNMTFFPNMMEHYDQDIAASKMEPFMPLVNLPSARQTCTHFLCRPSCRRAPRTPRLETCVSPDDGCRRRPRTTARTPRRPSGTWASWCPLPLKTRPGSSSSSSSSFLGAPDCAPPCQNMYFTPHEVEFAKSFIGVCSIVCLAATLFTFLTFLIDVKRFRYPERPIIFYAVCYSFVSLIYFVGFLLGDTAACSAAAGPGSPATVVLGSQQSKGCSLLFMLLYFFSTAGMVWWVILTITWFLAAGPKWSCEAIEKKAVWFHSAAWGIPGVLTVLLLALDKVEGDSLSGVCFVGLYDLTALRYFVLAPMCAGVLLGLTLLLAGIVSLNHVRRVIQHDERNRGKLKRFMIRIGVFSTLYLAPLLALLACYTSKKTCSQWAFFFNRTRKRDPISESRRVLQESCEFFLKHNSRVQHKKKHYKAGSHKLTVISKSMGTSTGAETANAAAGNTADGHRSHGTSTGVTATPVARAGGGGCPIAPLGVLGADVPRGSSGETSESQRRERLERGASGRSSRRGGGGGGGGGGGDRERDKEREVGERRSKTGSSSKHHAASNQLHGGGGGGRGSSSSSSRVAHPLQEDAKEKENRDGGC
ncbi:hypothetical protein CRUP_031416 [Coryphaenoides rupestris]|nr:hypothetical protein CRUP_031416 [Coryphaenoides rupestris]